MHEMLKGILFEDIPSEHQLNLIEFLPKLNVLRYADGFPWIVTSGYRTMEQHEDIYKAINDRKIAEGLPCVSIPLGSQHLFGHAADIADSDKKLKGWVLDNLDLLEDQGIYCEAFDYTPTWVHFQDIAPKNGKRFFIP